MWHFFIWRPVPTRKHCCRSKIASRTQEIRCLLSRYRFCVLNICCLGVQKRRHLRNTEGTQTMNVSPLFPRLHSHATYVEDVEFASQKPKRFLPSRFLTHATLWATLTQNVFRQCFLVCASIYIRKCHMTLRLRIRFSFFLSCRIAKAVNSILIPVQR